MNYLPVVDIPLDLQLVLQIVPRLAECHVHITMHFIRGSVTVGYLRCGDSGLVFLRRKGEALFLQCTLKQYADAYQPTPLEDRVRLPIRLTTPVCRDGHIYGV